MTSIAFRRIRWWAMTRPSAHSHLRKELVRLTQKQMNGGDWTFHNDDLFHWFRSISCGLQSKTVERCLLSTKPTQAIYWWWWPGNPCYRIINGASSRHATHRGKFQCRTQDHLWIISHKNGVHVIVESHLFIIINRVEDQPQPQDQLFSASNKSHFISTFCRANFVHKQMDSTSSQRAISDFTVHFRYRQQCHRLFWS